MALPGVLHPYFPSRDPERRWLFKLSLTIPAGVSGVPGVGFGVAANTASEIFSLNAQSVTVPSFSVDAITIPHLNQDVKVAGRPTLGDMSVTIINSYQMQSIAILEAWHHLIYNPGPETMGFAATYKTDGTLFVLYPNLDIYKQYIIQGCWPASIGDKEYDWSASESVTRTITFHVDKVLDPDNSGNLPVAAVAVPTGPNSIVRANLGV